MNGIARDLTGADMEETIAYEPEHDEGHDRPMGSPAMSKSTPQAQNRYTFSSGARPLDGYTIKRAIGRGGFGEVYYATSDAGKEVALKLILRNLEVERRGVVQCMNLKCPNLLTIHDLRTNDAGDTFVIMEYVAGPSLANVLAQHPKGLPLSDVRAWLKGLVDGVAYLHDHGIVHRDLKPANLFMEEGIVKIGDYGLAKLIAPSQGTEHSESIGTCHYMAPEIASGKYHKPIDVYATGIILYEMIKGRVPFEGETVAEVLMKHLTSRPDVSTLPEPYREIVARALAKDPNQRPSRVYDLLPPEDAPKTPAVRFIGEGKVGPPLPPESPKPDAEDILRIDAEEPVFYIGPDTQPPKPPRTARLARGVCARADWLRSRRAQARPAPAPPPPPPLPSGRVRVAELASSMVWSALLVLATALGACAAAGVDITAQPQRLAYLVGMGLAGSWGVLVANKSMEGRTVDSSTRRLIYFLIGIGLGILGLVLGQSIRLHLEPREWVLWANSPHPHWRYVPLVNNGIALRSLLFFGVLFALNNGWQAQTARSRKARFRVWPLAATGLLAALLSYPLPLWPYVEPYGIAVASMIAIATQMTSPWSPAAAAYARAYGRRQVA